MRSRTALVSLAVAALALAGCGGTKKAATTTATKTVPIGLRPVQPATYQVSLAGFPGGSPNGSGLAVINVTPSRDICWTFSGLKNVDRPTVARIFRNFPQASGRNGFALGRVYRPSGCVRVPRRTALLGLLEANPEEWYLSIHTARFPRGAVRGPA